ncbi:MAG: hypothetical protein ACRCWI_04555 [Brevinema sp.]
MKKMMILAVLMMVTGVIFVSQELPSRENVYPSIEDRFGNNA